MGEIEQANIKGCESLKSKRGTREKDSMMESTVIDVRGSVFAFFCFVSTHQQRIKKEN